RIFGEVEASEALLRWRPHRSKPVSVGVQLESGLLDLQVSSSYSPEELIAVMEAFRAKKKYHRLQDGSFIPVNSPDIEALITMADKLGIKPKDLAKERIHLPMYRALYLDSLAQEQEERILSYDGAFRTFVETFSVEQKSQKAFVKPSTVQAQLRPYQEEGFAWIRMLETYQFGGILADDMGLGKTLQVITALEASYQDGLAKPSLVVVPAALVYNWAEEFSKFAPNRKTVVIAGSKANRRKLLESLENDSVVITSYDLLKRDVELYESMVFGYHVIDEAQYIKNHKTAAAKSVKVIRSQFRLALTGTPVENRLSELWSIFDFVMPGFLYSYDQFKERWEEPIVKSQDQGAQEELQAMVSPFILRRLKRDVLKDLPDKIVEIKYSHMGDKQRKLYEGAVYQLQSQLSGQSAEEFATSKLQVLA
ncbi:MAG: SNF2 helicase associated domain-containing protein, partial [Veillonella sp.]|nr:SNF2 helicase associated domain-containing protein [Veillonella sp.]